MAKLALRGVPEVRDMVKVDPHCMLQAVEVEVEVVQDLRRHVRLVAVALRVVREDLETMARRMIKVIICLQVIRGKEDCL